MTLKTTIKSAYLAIEEISCRYPSDSIVGKKKVNWERRGATIKGSYIRRTCRRACMCTWGKRAISNEGQERERRMVDCGASEGELGEKVIRISWISNTSLAFCWNVRGELFLARVFLFLLYSEDAKKRRSGDRLSGWWGIPLERFLLFRFWSRLTFFISILISLFIAFFVLVWRWWWCFWREMRAHAQIMDDDDLILPPLPYWKKRNAPKIEPEMME